MEIKNRITDIRYLHTHILQDLFRLEIANRNLNERWRDDFKILVEANIKGKFKIRYQGAWKAIQRKGIDSYDISDMDITLLTAIHSFNNTFTISKDLNDAISNLADERNYDAHISCNESSGELLGFAYGTLYELSKLLDKAIVSLKKDEALNAFIRKYNTEIKKLRENLEEDYRKEISELAVIKHDVEIILSSKNRTETWMNITRLYSAQPINVGLYKRFLLEAASNKITESYEELGNIYFGEYGTLFGPVAYKESAKYYELNRDELMLPSYLNLVSIYVNGIMGEKKQRLGEQLLTELKKEHSGIVSYKTEEGYTFYTTSARKSFHDAFRTDSSIVPPVVTREEVEGHS